MNPAADSAMHGDDSELAARCQTGDQAACAELMHRYREVVYRVAYAVTGDRDQAEDVVQEAFVRAYTARKRFDRRRSFAAWIKRITVNCALNALRQEAAGGPAATRESGGDHFPSQSDAAGSRQ